MKLFQSDDIIILDCTYQQKDVAIFLGFKWDREIKCWYSNNRNKNKRLSKLSEQDLLDIEKRFKNNFDLSFASDSKIEIPKPDGLDYLPFQKAGIEFAINNKQTLNASEMGCISGDMVITVNRAGNGKKIKLRDLFFKFNGGNKRGKFWDLSIETKTASMNDNGDLRLNQIKNVLYKGIKDVVRVKVEGNYSIDLTPDHEVFTKDGWQEIQNLSVGKEIALNGVSVCLSCNENKKVATYKHAKFKGVCNFCIRRLYKRNTIVNGKFKDKDGYVRWSSNVRNHPYVNKCGYVYEHILVMESCINNLTMDQFINKIKHNDILDLVFIDRNTYNVHHKNHIRGDNRIENLEQLTVQDHRKKHDSTNHFPNMKIHYGKILSIENIGEIDVYDIVMDDPNRNFVANGIVVHNCGKSIQAIGYMNYSQFKNVLVVTTASLKLNWQKEIEKWITYPINIQVLESSKKFKYDDGVLICNYDVLKKFSDQLERSNFDLIIADEVHYVKNKNAMRSHIFYNIVKNIEHKMYLSGTPVVDRPLELYNIIKSLGYNRTKSEYTSLYCPLIDNGFALVPGPATNLDLLQKELRSQFMYRVMKKDVLQELPDKFKQIIYIEDKKSLKAEQNAIKGFMNNTNLSNEEYNSFISSTTAFTPQFIGLIAQIRKETAINKLPFAINLIRETLESKDKIVVFAHHKEVVSGLYEAFKDIAVKLDGGTKMEDRQLVVDQFQNNKDTRLFIGSILASGTGITLTASNHVIFVEMDWTPSNMTQAEDRLHRIGQHDNVTIQYIVVDNSIDAMVAKKLIKKEKVFDEMFNR